MFNDVFNEEYNEILRESPLVVLHWIYTRKHCLHVWMWMNTESYHVGRVEVEGVPVPDGLVLPGRGRGLARHVEAGGDRQHCLASTGMLLLLLCEAGFVGLEPLVAGALVISWRSLKGVWLYKQIYSVHKIFVSTVNIDILFLFSRWHTTTRKLPWKVVEESKTELFSVLKTV